MSNGESLTHTLVKHGPLERWLARPAVGRFGALFFAGLGLASGIASFVFIGTLMQRPDIPPRGVLAKAMEVAGQGAIVTAVIFAALLGLYLAIRGHRKQLPRLLALACGSLAALIGVLLALKWGVDVFLGPKNFRVGATTIGLIVPVTVFGIVTATFSGFAIFTFLVLYPKPVKLLDMQFTPEGAPIRDGSPPFEWNWLLSPQFAALAAGVALMVLLAWGMDVRESQAGLYFVCWFPFAVLAAKQTRLGEEDRRNVSWVFLGQTVWLVLFLASLLLINVLQGGGVLKFASWNDGAVFLQGFYRVAFSACIIILLATLAVSILYHGTMDPDLMIRRTWVLAVVGVVCGGIFVTVERLLADVIAKWLEVSAANALTVVGAITAGIVYPMRAFLEARSKAFIERWRAAQAIADGIRQEAVVVFAGLDGYAQLTEVNEREALIMAAIFHRDAQDVAASREGALVKTLGEAVMMRFEDVARAVAAVEELKLRYRGHVEGMAMMPLTIQAAIHRGEVVEGPKGDLFGATVNTTAKLLRSAAPGEVVLSATAATE